ncbi:aminoglycoside phosphotransferase [Porphyrobacter sp. MBR-155]|jgi:aminoglycoside phosphotransferase|uniref:phosphotransferase family protein n=1 Tax=Porphyrobacter sp. MBR-155 TaxID=3156464 RepID=UPI00339291BA
MASAIPQGLRDEIEQQTGSVIVSEKPRGGGGASRQGAEVLLRFADGRETQCYLAWDARAGEASRLAYFQRETAILSALSGPYRQAGIKVAPLVATFPSHLALLSEFVGGNDRFALAQDKGKLATDFVGQLATLHRLDASDPAFAELGDCTELPSQRISQNLAQWSADNQSKVGDPVYQVALHWLARNIPPDTGPAVVLHGDAGPGNFLFHEDRVTAIVDWELTHLGDPAEDLAQIWVRSLIQPFVPMRNVFAAYSAAVGGAVDVARVKYHRLYFQLSFSVPSAVLAAAEGSRLGATGTALMFGTMHKRVIVRAVAELAGISLEEPDLPGIEPDWTERYFDTALADLQEEIVPAAGNQRAASKAKELARLIKFWRMRARYGAAFDAAEFEELKHFLPEAPDGLLPARSALTRAIADQSVDFSAAVQLCYNRVVRETVLMADAMGGLATTWYDDFSQ